MKRSHKSGASFESHVTFLAARAKCQQPLVEEWRGGFFCALALGLLLIAVFSRRQVIARTWIKCFSASTCQHLADCILAGRGNPRSRQPLAAARRGCQS